MDKRSKFALFLGLLISFGLLLFDAFSSRDTLYMIFITVLLSRALQLKYEVEELRRIVESSNHCREDRT